jgi:hypothetical protein
MTHVNAFAMNAFATSAKGKGQPLARGEEASCMMETIWRQQGQGQQRTKRLGVHHAGHLVVSRHGDPLIGVALQKMIKKDHTSLGRKATHT